MCEMWMPNRAWERTRESERMEQLKWEAASSSWVGWKGVRWCLMGGEGRRRPPPPHPSTLLSVLSWVRVELLILAVLYTHYPLPRNNAGITAKKFRFIYSLKRNCLSPNLHIYASVSDLYILTIGPRLHIFSCSRIGRPIVGIYKLLTETWM